MHMKLYLLILLIPVMLYQMAAVPMAAARLSSAQVSTRWSMGDAAADRCLGIIPRLRKVDGRSEGKARSSRIRL